jgi:tellurite resistance protein
MGKIIEAQQLLDRLEKSIVEDDNVSNEEKQLLVSIRDNVGQYKDLMDEAMADNIVSDEEYRRIHIIEKKIIQDASAIAFSDGKVSDDEKKIMGQIIEIFESINK